MASITLPMVRRLKEVLFKPSKTTGKFYSSASSRTLARWCMDSKTWRFRSVYQCPYSSKSSLPEEQTNHPLTTFKSPIWGPGQARYVHYSCILAVVMECARPDRHHDWCLDRWTYCISIWPPHYIRCWGLDLRGRYCSRVYRIVSWGFPCR